VSNERHAVRQERRNQIKQTVERVAPALEDIDTTRVLSDEEQAELQRRMEEARTNSELAKKLGREGLRAALKEKLTVAMQKITNE
jgi:hypothetical protein